MIPIKSVGSELNNEASCILRNGKGFAVFSHRCSRCHWPGVTFLAAGSAHCSLFLVGWQLVHNCPDITEVGGIKLTWNSTVLNGDADQ